VIDLVVMAHRSRERAADDLVCRAAPFGCRIIWDQANDEWDTGSRAWAAIPPDADWGIVLQDDAQLVDDFAEHAAAALTDAPRTAVSFYVGTGRPRPSKVRTAVRTAHASGASWLECDALLWGVAIALPAEHLRPMLDWAETETLPYDQRISRFYQRVLGQPVRYTWPSLVDHADGPSLVDHRRRAPMERHAHQVGPWQPDGPVIQI
jgi:hypothetical protein